MNLLIKNILGIICILVIKIVQLCPKHLSLGIFKLGLPLYRALRFKQVSRVASRIKASPFAAQISIKQYYSSRLHLLINSIKQHDPRVIPPKIKIVNQDIFTALLKSGNPIVLCGLHLGLFELLHKLPFQDIAKAGKSFVVLTAPAFSPVFTHYLNQGRIDKNKHIMGNHNLFQAIRKTLSIKGVLGVMLDQSPIRQEDTITLWNALQLPFNHKLLEFMFQKGSILLPLSTWIDKNGAIILKYHEALTPFSKKSDKAEIWKIPVRNFLEKAIAQAPEQWNWSYPGFSTISREKR